MKQSNRVKKGEVHGKGQKQQHHGRQQRSSTTVKNKIISKVAAKVKRKATAAELARACGGALLGGLLEDALADLADANIKVKVPCRVPGQAARKEGGVTHGRRREELHMEELLNREATPHRWQSTWPHISPSHRQRSLQYRIPLRP